MTKWVYISGSYIETKHSSIQKIHFWYIYHDSMCFNPTTILSHEIQFQIVVLFRMILAALGRLNISSGGGRPVEMRGGG